MYLQKPCGICHRLLARLSLSGKKGALFTLLCWTHFKMFCEGQCPAAKHKLKKKSQKSQDVYNVQRRPEMLSKLGQFALSPTSLRSYSFFEWGHLNFHIRVYAWNIYKSNLIRQGLWRFWVAATLSAGTQEKHKSLLPVPLKSRVIKSRNTEWQHSLAIEFHMCMYENKA